MYLITTCPCWFHSKNFVSNLFGYHGTPQTSTTPCKCIKNISISKICISRQSEGLRRFDSWKTLKKHFIYQDMMVSCTVSDSGMNFVSRQNSCFASLAGVASLCSFNKLPKSFGATLLQLSCTILYSVHLLFGRLTDWGLIRIGL